MWWLAILNFFNSKLFKTLLPFIIGDVVAGALFLTGYNMGSTSANRQCKAAEYAREVKALQLQADNLKKQHDADQIVIAQLTAQKTKIQVVTQDVIKTVTKLVPDNRACDIHNDVIDQINKARSGVK